MCYPFRCMSIKKLTSLSNIQRFLLGLFVLFSTTMLLAVPHTLFQYLDLQYRIQHQAELRYTTNSYLTTSDGSRVQTYAYRDSPWAFASKISGYAFLLIPPFTTIIVSVLYFLTSKQRTSRSLFQALSLSALFFSHKCHCKLAMGNHLLGWLGMVYRWPSLVC